MINPSRPPSKVVPMLPKNSPPWAQVRVSLCLQFFCGQGTLCPCCAWPGPHLCAAASCAITLPSLPQPFLQSLALAMLSDHRVFVHASPPFFPQLTSYHPSYPSTGITSAGEPSLTWLPSSCARWSNIGCLSLSQHLSQLASNDCLRDCLVVPILRL